MRRAATFVEGFTVTALYSSPRRRALQSAQILVPHLTHRIDERLSEIDFGELEGLTYQDAAIRYPDVYQAWMQRPDAICFPGGESFARMQSRVTAAVTDLLRMHAGDSITVVAHGGVNRIVLGQALGLATHQLFELRQDYGAINLVEYCDGTPAVRLLNTTPAQRVQRC